MNKDEHEIGAIIGTVHKKLILGIWGGTYSAILLNADDDKDVGFVVIDLESKADSDLSAAVVTSGKTGKEWERVADDEKRDVQKILKKSIFDDIGVGTKIRCAGFDTNQKLGLFDEGVETAYPIFAGVIINKQD